MDYYLTHMEISMVIIFVIGLFGSFYEPGPVPFLMALFGAIYILGYEIIKAGISMWRSYHVEYRIIRFPVDDNELFYDLKEEA